VEFTNVVAGADPPKLTIEAAMKFVPLIVSVNAAPPAADVFGEIEVIVGASGGGGFPADLLVPLPHALRMHRPKVETASNRKLFIVFPLSAGVVPDAGGC
jgi:hypothetical protein